MERGETEMKKQKKERQTEVMNNRNMLMLLKTLYVTKIYYCYQESISKNLSSVFAYSR